MIEPLRPLSGPKVRHLAGAGSGLGGGTSLASLFEGMVMTADVLVIGGGQAGLATGYYLQRQRADFRIVGAAPSPGHTWRSRWDSVVLFTSRRYCALPGLPLPGDSHAYPGKDDVADYLDAYAERFDLPLQLDTRVASLESDGRGFRAHTPHGPIAARAVIVATGPFQTVRTPRISSGSSAGVGQLHSSVYLAQLPDGRTLVVGGGNSGFQIALELAHAGRDVHLAEGTRNVAATTSPWNSPGTSSRRSATCSTPSRNGDEPS